MDKLSVDVLTKREQFLQIATEWESALTGSSQTSLYMSHNWISCWLTSFGENSELRILIARDKSGVTGFCPLELGRLRFGLIHVSCVRLLTNEYSSHSDVIVLRRAEETVRAFMQKIDALPWKVFEFGRVPDHSKGLLAVAEEWYPQFSCVAKRKTYEMPRINVSASWEDFLKLKKRHFRKRLKYNVALADSLSPNESCRMALDQLFDDIITVSEQTWKHQEGTSLARSVKAWQFYRAIMKSAHDDGRLSYVLLYEKANPVAFVFGVRYGDTHYLLKIGYDEKIRRMSPGFNVMVRFIQHACMDTNTKWVELGCITSGGSGGEFKRRWATDIDHVSDYYFFRHNIAAIGMGLAYRGMRKLKRLLKREV